MTRVDRETLSFWIIDELCPSGQPVSGMLEGVFLSRRDRNIYGPSAKELERLVRSQRQQYVDGWLHEVRAALPPETVAAMESSLADAEGPTGFNAMKGDAGRATLDNILEVTERLAFIRKLALPWSFLSNINPAWIEHVVRRVSGEKASEMRRHTEACQLALYAVYLMARETAITDAMVELLLGLVLLAGPRRFIGGMMPLNSLWRNRWTGSWRRIVALGAPVSLGFIGMALSAASVVLALRLVGSTDYAKTIAAYGIMTRIFGFAFLPIMAIAMAMQSIVGNNVGARLYIRSDAVLRIAAATALFYCLAVEVLLLSEGAVVGAAFVADPAVIGEVGRMLRPMAAIYLFSGPVLVLGLYFQAIGQPARAALLTMVKPFVLLPVLVAAAAATLGADAIWFAFPLADGVAAIVATLVLADALKARGDAGIGLKAVGNPS